MLSLYKYLIASAYLFSFTACEQVKKPADIYPFQLAFIADPHIQDVVNHPHLIRTMESQVHSTRLFNENYFAFIAALDDAAQKGIKHIVIPGDLTDNGQLINQNAVRKILEKYTQTYRISFYFTTGNHDPSQPRDYENCDRNFLTSNGEKHTICSSLSISNQKENQCIQVDTTLKGAGYKKQLECYQQFGFFPQQQYLYWETPFSTYSYDNYSYSKAAEQSATNCRQYLLTDSISAIDASYLVEPIPGIWLLAIDGSVHKPKSALNEKQEFQGSGDGYNNILQYKPFLLPWVKKIASEAQRLHKTLIAFSHYPLIEFNDGASKTISKAWGDNKFDLSRVPKLSVSKAFLQAGIQLHFAGHMHINNTNILSDEQGHKLYNIQVPSIATYSPAYKIATVKNEYQIEIKTIYLDSIVNFNQLFPFYEKEYSASITKHKQPVWQKKILQSRNYHEFCDYIFQDLVRLRFIPNDLPTFVQDSIVPVNGLTLFEQITGHSPSQDSTSWKSWNGYELILDLYRLRYADVGALKDIPNYRMKQYQQLFQEVSKSTSSSDMVTHLRNIATIYNYFLHGIPCDSLFIDLRNSK